MRTLRSKLSAEQQSRLQNKAKVNMSAGRRNGFVRKYKQREKRDKNHLNIWKKFLKTINLDLFEMAKPKLVNIHIRLNKLAYEVKMMENRRREEAHLRSRMPTWKPERAFKERTQGVI